MKDNAIQIMLRSFEEMKSVILNGGNTKSPEYLFSRGIFVKSLRYLEGWSMLSPLQSDEFDE